MKLVHRLFTSTWFRFLSAAGFGFVIHDRYPNGVIAHPLSTRRCRGPVPWWGSLLYALGFILGCVGVFLNFSGAVEVGTPIIGSALTLTLSTALSVGHLKKW